MNLSRSEDYGDGKHHGGPAMSSPERVMLEHAVGGLTLPLEKLAVEVTRIHVDEISNTIEFNMTYTLHVSDVNAAKREHKEQHRPTQYFDPPPEVLKVRTRPEENEEATQ